MQSFEEAKGAIESAGKTGRKLSDLLGAAVADACAGIKASETLPRRFTTETLPELQSPDQKKMHEFVVWVVASSDLAVDYKFELIEAAFHIPLTGAQAKPLTEYLRRQAIDSGKVGAVIETVDKIFTKAFLTQGNASALAGVLHETQKVGGQTPTRIIDMIFSNLGVNPQLSPEKQFALAGLLGQLAIRRDLYDCVLQRVGEQFTDSENSKEESAILVRTLEIIARNHKPKVAALIDGWLVADAKTEGHLLNDDERTALQNLKTKLVPSAGDVVGGAADHHKNGQGSQPPRPTRSGK